MLILKHAATWIWKWAIPSSGNLKLGRWSLTNGFIQGFVQHFQSNPTIYFGVSVQRDFCISRPYKDFTMKLEDIAPRMVCFWRICSEFAQCRFIDLSPGIDWDNLRAAIPSFLTITAWRFSVTPEGWIWSWHFSTELAWMIIQVVRFFFPLCIHFRRFTAGSPTHPTSCVTRVTLWRRALRSYPLLTRFTMASLQDDQKRVAQTTSLLADNLEKQRMVDYLVSDEKNISVAC